MRRDVGGSARWFALGLGAVWVCVTPGCSGPDANDDDASTDDDDSSPAEPGEYEDAWVLADLGELPIPLPEMQDVLTFGDLVLVCTNRTGTHVFNAADPDALEYVNTFDSQLSSDLQPRCQHLAASGDVVYISSRGDFHQGPFVAAFDFDSLPPTEIASFEAATSVEGIVAVGDLVYVGLHEGGLGVLRQEGSSLNLIGTADGLTNAWGVAVDGTTVYVADGLGGLAVVDVSDPEAPVVVGQTDVGGFAQTVVVDADVVYVGAGGTGVVIVDVGTPSSPQVLGTLETPGTALQLALAGGRLYVADWTSARVYDRTDPRAPTLAATETLFNAGAFTRILGIAARGDVAFLGEWVALHSYRFFEDRDAPDIRLSPPRTVNFGNVEPGNEASARVTVSNEGQELLVVYEIGTAGPGFAADAGKLALAPGESRALYVTFAPEDDELTTGELTLRSDDPDEPEQRIALVGNGGGIGVGNPAGEVVVDLVGGGQWRLSEQDGTIVVLAYFATF